MSGADIFYTMLEKAGVEYLFGNPGTTELPLIDALFDHPTIRYILGLQEIPVMAIADGYAQASRRLGVINLHISCGLGNAMGMLYNAYRSGTPLLVTAGQQDQRFIDEEPILWGDMVAVARPWTKWAAEVRRIEDLPTAIRRAIQIALSPPTGPVFLSLPLDIQLGECKVELTAPVVPPPPCVPPSYVIQEAAQILCDAKDPAIIVGSKVCEAGAIAGLVRLAELLGAPVFHEPYTTHGRCSFPPGHPLAAGLLPYWAPEIRSQLAQFDTVLAVGIKLFEQYIYHGPIRAIPESTLLIQIDDDPWQIGKNYPVRVGLWGQFRDVLEHLIAAVEKQAQMCPPPVQERFEFWAERNRSARAALRQQAASQMARRPLTTLAMLELLGRCLPENVAIIEEGPTTSGAYFERAGYLPNPEGYFAQRGWALGWGLNCAIGVRLAWPDRPVLAIIGDGSALYGIQGLWTAAHYRIPVTFLIANNRQYRILKNCAQVLRLPHASRQEFQALDLTDPLIDYVKLAESLGVRSVRVDEPDSLPDIVRLSLSADKPYLIEVPLQAEV